MILSTLQLVQLHNTCTFIAYISPSLGKVSRTRHPMNQWAKKEVRDRRGRILPIQTYPI